LEAQAFIDDAELFFKMNPDHVPDDWQKIQCAISNISGGAKEWKQNKLNNLRATDALWTDWNTFK